ncbi:MAG: acyltransferase [Nocardia sp.]|uniref:acyltransferase family protein n=1 Tax=Nocardia sp. TaxID=1821 RepID=UPI002632D52D|nr:acyltransferase [Nocardia sp.]MCU1643369.1 acyltransferase [Nocardia sp.]
MTTSDEAVANPIEPVEEKVRTRGGRFEFLDALRGVAALAVVIEHCSELMWPGYERFSAAYFGAGVFGVFVFFIVSGYIIPASLERGRSLGAFWAGRFFRLFPLFWGCLIAAMILHALRMYGGPPGWMASPAWNIFTNFTMAHWFISGPNSQMVVVAWTLSYELVFYMVVSLLFIGRLNRRSVPLAVLAIGSMLLAELFLPTSMVNGSDANLATRLIVVAATAVVAVFFARRAATRRSAVAAVLLASLAIPLVLNQPGPSGYSAAIFATMFVGTVMYRMTAGEITARLGWGVFGLAVCAVIGLALLQQPALETKLGVLVTWKHNAITMAAAYLLFAATLLLRRYSFPRPLLFLGRISYSLYFVHALAINFLPKWTVSVAGIPAAWLTWCTWVFGSIALATLTYHKVEKPFLNLGHRVIAKMDARAQPIAIAAK